MPLSLEQLAALRRDAENKTILDTCKVIEDINHNLDLFDKQIKSMKRQRMDAIMVLIDLGCTYELVSEVLNVSRARVSQMIADHRKLLRHEDDIENRRVADEAIAIAKARQAEKELEQPQPD